MQEEFKNIKAVADFLIAQGWKITQRSVYNHAKAGLLGKKKNGVYTLRQVNTYCRDWLKTQDAHETEQDEDLNRKLKKNESDLKEEQAKLARLKREEAEGKLVKKDDVMLQLAARAAVFENGFKGFVRSEAGRIIKAMDGDPLKTADFIEIMYEGIDQELNSYARPVVFEVDFNEVEEDGIEE